MDTDLSPLKFFRRVHPTHTCPANRSLQLKSHFFFKDFKRSYSPLPSPDLSFVHPSLTINFPRPPKQYFPCFCPDQSEAVPLSFGVPQHLTLFLSSALPGSVICTLASPCSMLNFFKAGIVFAHVSSPTVPDPAPVSVEHSVDRLRMPFQ